MSQFCLTLRPRGLQRTRPPCFTMLKLVSIRSMRPSNRLILLAGPFSCTLSLPQHQVSVSQLFTSLCFSIGALTSVLPVGIQL